MNIQNYISKKITARRTEAGVTLLLAVLLLSAITAISFSLATIIFIEIRASGDLTRTEPALYSTQALIEEAIIKVKRAVPNTGSTWPSGKNYTTFNNNFGDCSNWQSTTIAVNAVNMQTKLCSLNLDPAYTDVVPVTSTTFVKTKNIYTLLNPDAPYVDANSNGSLDGLYGKILLKYASGPDMRLYVCKVTSQDCTNAGDGTLNTNADYSITGTSGVLFNATNGNSTNAGVNAGGCVGPLPASTMCYTLEPLSAYQIFVHLVASPPPASNAYIEVHTCGGTNGSPTDADCTPLQYRGLAFPGRKTVDISAGVGALLTRRYRVFIPE